MPGHVASTIASTSARCEAVNRGERSSRTAGPASAFGEMRRPGGQHAVQRRLHFFEGMRATVSGSCRVKVKKRHGGQRSFQGLQNTLGIRPIPADDAAGEVPILAARTAVFSHRTHVDRTRSRPFLSQFHPENRPFQGRAVRSQLNATSTSAVQHPPVRQSASSNHARTKRCNLPGRRQRPPFVGMIEHQTLWSSAVLRVQPALRRWFRSVSCSGARVHLTTPRCRTESAAIQRGCLLLQRRPRPLLLGQGC